MHKTFIWENDTVVMTLYAAPNTHTNKTSAANVMTCEGGEDAVQKLHIGGPLTIPQSGTNRDYYGKTCIHSAKCNVLL